MHIKAMGGNTIKNISIMNGDDGYTTIKRNGKTFRFKGESVSLVNDQLFIDDQEVKDPWGEDYPNFTYETEKGRKADGAATIGWAIIAMGDGALLYVLQSITDNKPSLLALAVWVLFNIVAFLALKKITNEIRK